MAMVRMYLPLLALRSQLKRTMVVNAKKNDELRLTDTMSDFEDDEQEVAYDFSADKAEEEGAKKPTKRRKQAADSQ